MTLGILLLCFAILAAGCSGKAVSPTASEQDKMQQQAEEEKQEEQQEEKQEELTAEVKLQEAVKIALIDTGIAKEAVNAGQILPGWN